MPVGDKLVTFAAEQLPSGSKAHIKSEGNRRVEKSLVFNVICAAHKRRAIQVEGDGMPTRSGEHTNPGCEPALINGRGYSAGPSITSDDKNSQYKWEISHSRFLQHFANILRLR